MRRWRDLTQQLGAALNGRAQHDAHWIAVEQAWQRKQALAAARCRVAAMDDWAVRIELTRIVVATVAMERAERANHQRANPTPPAIT
ncbi:hypothetical protein [Streptacidiphilus albus]|uniref:hypothetical protein n=1 Tax=Streptacidiphilus albus TaxID=105425 RepID=UPI00054C5274|nr:hypothetical protein [Streptacidiphilus albus]